MFDFYVVYILFFINSLTSLNFICPFQLVSSFDKNSLTLNINTINPTTDAE